MTVRYLFIAACVVFNTVHAQECKNETIVVPDFEVKDVDFRHENGYARNQNCVWRFEGKSLLMQLSDLYLGKDDAIYLYNGTTMTQDNEVEKDDDGAEANTKVTTLITAGTAVLRFVSGDSSDPNMNETGFTVFAIAGSDKSGFTSDTQKEVNLSATEQKQIVTSPGFPNKYSLAKKGSTKTWTWNIQAEGATSITLSFIYMDIQKSSDCKYHVIELYGHGMSANATKLCVKDGWDMTKYTYSFPVEEIHLKFKVDEYDARRGFVAEYSAEPGSTPTGKKVGGCDVLNCIVPIVVIAILVIVAVIIVIVLVRKRKSKKYKPTETSEEKTAMPLSEEQEPNEQEKE